MPALTKAAIRELTLDPDNWEELRTLGHRMVDDIFGHLATLREQPAWQHGNYAIRVANVNHRSRMEDFEVLARDVVPTGRIILEEAKRPNDRIKTVD